MGIESGESIRLTCIAGVTNAGGGLPNSDCRGLLEIGVDDGRFV